MYESGACTPYKLCLACSVVTGRAPWGHRRRASLGLYGHARELRGKLEEVVGVVPRVCGGRGGGGGGRSGPVGELARQNASASQSARSGAQRGAQRGSQSDLSASQRALSGRGWPRLAAVPSCVWWEASGGRRLVGGAPGAARISALDSARRGHPRWKGSAPWARPVERSPLLLLSLGEYSASSPLLVLSQHASHPCWPHHW